MKLYKIIDRECCGFMDWTHETPKSKNYLRLYLRDMANDGKTCDTDMWSLRTTLDDMLELFNLDIEEA